jgi:hypothetical protein
MFNSTVHYVSPAKPQSVNLNFTVIMSCTDTSVIKTIINLTDIIVIKVIMDLIDMDMVYIPDIPAIMNSLYKIRVMLNMSIFCILNAVHINDSEWKMLKEW